MERSNIITIVLTLILLALLGIAGIFMLERYEQSQQPLVGGQRDDQGCLIAAGYIFDDTIGACVRNFELSDDEKRSAKLAVETIGREYALTVVDVQTRQCQGCFSVTLESGEGRNRQTVTLDNWEVVEPMTVNLYYYNEEDDMGSDGNIMCSREGLVAVEREIASAAPIEDTLRLLLQGNLTAEEQSQGITTEYPLPGFRLASSTLQNGTLLLAFEDPQNRTSGGSCRAGILWFQVEETALQFSEVENVEFTPEDIFQP